MCRELPRNKRVKLATRYDSAVSRRMPAKDCPNAVTVRGITRRDV
jgi:hypothetical protein